MGATDARLVAVELDEASLAARTAELEQERVVAIQDLLAENRFAPVGCGDGPFRLRLLMAENRLTFDIRDASDAPLCGIPVALPAFRSVVRDYLAICDSYRQALRHGSLARVEALDMGRRGLHDEGAGLLRDRLADQVDIDHATARRLFTLFCVLHLRGEDVAAGPLPPHPRPSQ